MKNLLAAVQRLPRAVQWALLAAIAMVVYFLVVERTLDAINRFAGSSATREAMLASYAKTESDLRAAADTVLLGTKYYGDVAMPGDPEQRALEFNRAVDEILKKHDIREHTSTSRTSPMGPGRLVAKFGGEYRIDRLIKDIQFVADPDAVSGVVADLERNPVVASVSRVQIRQMDARDRSLHQVRANIAAETWLLARKGKTR